MDKKSEDVDTSTAVGDTSVVIDSASGGVSNPKSGKESDASEKMAQPLDHEKDIDEDLLLCTSSDIEAFEDKHGVKEIKETPADGKKSDKYFSDIESSDNSQEYQEQQSVEEDGVVTENKVVDLEKEEKRSDVGESEDKHKEPGKTAKLELEPVESDEDNFDESLSVKKIEGAPREKDAVKETAQSEVMKDLEEISDREEVLSQEEDVAISTEGNKKALSKEEVMATSIEKKKADKLVEKEETVLVELSKELEDISDKEEALTQEEEVGTKIEGNKEHKTVEKEQTDFVDLSKELEQVSDKEEALSQEDEVATQIEGIKEHKTVEKEQVDFLDLSKDLEEVSDKEEALSQEEEVATKIEGNKEHKTVEKEPTDFVDLSKELEEVSDKEEALSQEDEVATQIEGIKEHKTVVKEQVDFLDLSKDLEEVSDKEEALSQEEEVATKIEGNKEHKTVEKEPTDFVDLSKELEEVSDKEEALSQEEEVAESIEESKETKDEDLITEQLVIPEGNEKPSAATLTKNKCETKGDKETQVTAGKAVAVESVSKEEQTLNIEMETESTVALNTEKEDAVLVINVDELEPSKAKQSKTDQKEIPAGPIAKETDKKIDEDNETTKEENKKTDVTSLSSAETSVPQIDGSSTEKVKEREQQKSDESVVPSTKEVSKVAALSSASQQSEGLDSTSEAEMKSPKANITPEKNYEALASPEKGVVSKEAHKIAEKGEACAPKEVDIQTEDVLISNKSNLCEEKPKGDDTKSDTCKADTKGTGSQTEQAQNSEKADLGEAVAKSTDIPSEDASKSDQQAAKAEDKSEEVAEEDDVLTVVEIESDAEDKQEENEAEIKEDKQETTAVEGMVEKSTPPSDENKEKIEPQAKAADQPKDKPSVVQPADDKANAPSKLPDTTNETSDENSYLKDKLTTKVSELMKTIDTSSLQGLTSDDDESLLVIDTNHKEDNEQEDNDMDTETEQTVATGSSSESSSDGSLEIFYNKECSNYDCQHGSKNFYRAPQFALSYYKVSKKRYKSQFVCEDCYDQALREYAQMCVILKQRQPLYGANIKRQDFIEIIDSSDEEDTESNADNCNDENTLPKESIEFLENELEGIIRNVMQTVDIQNQLSWTKQMLQQSLDRVTEESRYVTEQLQQLQKKADTMHNSLYQSPRAKIRQLTPLDLNSGRSYSPESESTIPPAGDITRPPIQPNKTYYAVKNKAIASWVPCKVIEEVQDSTSQAKNLKHFKIKFLKAKIPIVKTVSAKHMAYFEPPKIRLPLGTRVIAYFDASTLLCGKEKILTPSAFYPGIIAEPLMANNKYRYLVFYDDGYFQYVSYKDVRLVCYASDNVWEDVHYQSRGFIHNYVTQYAVNKPMVHTAKGQDMLVDYNGKWVHARVADVDCSLVQMMFDGQTRSEWIFRGSTRLEPVYRETNNIAPKRNWNQTRISKRNEPYIRYVHDEESVPTQQIPPPPAKSGEVRSVAKKSVSRTETVTSAQPPPVVRHLNNSTIFVDDDTKPKGKVVYYTTRRNLGTRDYVPHICGPSCSVVPTHNLSNYHPLAKPLLSGWERQVFRQKTKKFIVYRGPCGKRLRNMDELHRYLRVIEHDLNVDHFDFSTETNCLAEYVIETCIVENKDISNGEEQMPVPCVNYYDDTMPPDCTYSSSRIPTEGVNLNLDIDFLVGCDCEDDCSDKSKCSCWQLTYAGAKYSMPNVPLEMVGYQYKRLFTQVPTGIYECNARCKCKSNCINRVVQEPLKNKLQIFKTSNRGWGLRCTNDVPRGCFICIYAGHLLTEQNANEGGVDAGDEYFAELDYMEVAEQIKEGYESDVVEPDDDEDMYNPDKDDDDDEFIAPEGPNLGKSISTRISTRRTTKNGSDAEHDSQERQVISFEPNKSQERPSSSTARPKMRTLFGKEGPYVMDAKVTGNLGRYFNHSCSPNLYVQNVLVDTHDLRFPWVAFFASSHIRAGTELTWNYNYEVGVVPGKVLYCQCGAPNCRQRLL